MEFRDDFSFLTHNMGEDIIFPHRLKRSKKDREALSLYAHWFANRLSSSMREDRKSVHTGQCGSAAVLFL